IDKTGAGTLLLSGPDVFIGLHDTITIHAGVAKVAIATLYSGSLSIDPAAALDLNDNDLVMNYGTLPNPFTTIRDYVFAGYSSSPDATKTGIISSAGQTAGNTILALIDNSLVGAGDWPLGSGRTIDANAVIGKYTYFGDMDFDGQ